MKKYLCLLALPFLLSACASNPSTQQSWACRAVGNTTCSTISQIDNEEVPTSTKRASRSDVQTEIFGAQPAAWWDKSLPTSTTREDAPRRESDQTMRIIVAPWVDQQGDYHDRTVVYAVMRKANWWVVPPEAVQSEPAPGTRLPADTTHAPPAQASLQSAPSTAPSSDGSSTVPPQAALAPAPVAPVAYVVSQPGQPTASAEQPLSKPSSDAPGAIAGSAAKPAEAPLKMAPIPDRQAADRHVTHRRRHHHRS